MFYKRTLFWALCRDSITSSPCFPEMSVARVNKITNEKVLAHRTELWECGARKVTPRIPRGLHTSIYFHWYFYSRDGLRPKGGSVRSIQGIFITKITVLYLSDLPRSVQKQSPWETNLSPMVSFYSTVEEAVKAYEIFHWKVILLSLSAAIKAMSQLCDDPINHTWSPEVEPLGESLRARDEKNFAPRVPFLYLFSFWVFPRRHTLCFRVHVKMNKFVKNEAQTSLQHSIRIYFT